MVSPEAQEGPDNLNCWLSQIRQRWSNALEFCVGTGNLEHLAVICDGNRHSAQAKGLLPQYGHRLGMEVIRGIMSACRNWGIDHVTFWVWSTDNWQRGSDQVEFIMDLAAKNLIDFETVQELMANEVRFTHFGRKDRVPDEVVQGLNFLEKQTAGFSRYKFNLAFDYGGIDEVGEAMARILDEYKEGRLSADQIRQNPRLIYDYLYTANQPLPNLIIRTGMREGELPRTSGFFPLQTSYSCWAFVEENFPDLDPDTLLQAIKSFLNYNRRVGK